MNTQDYTAKYTVILILATMLMACIPFMANGNNMELGMSAIINQDCDFSQLDLSVPAGKNTCSPVVTEKQIFDGLTGIFINMPRKIAVGQANEIKVCMLSILKSSDAAKLGGTELLVLKNETTNQVYNGRFIEEDREEPIPEDDMPPPVKVSSNRTQELYFNFNLNTYIDFERTPGLYHLYIVMGPFKSNVVSFEIVDNK